MIEWIVSHCDAVLMITAGLFIGALAELVKLIVEIWRDR